MKTLRLLIYFAAVAVIIAGCATGGVRKGKYVEIYSRSCHVCQRMDSILDEIEGKYSSVLDINTYIDTSETGEEMVKKYGIKRFPANIFLDMNGKILFRYEGLLDKQAIEEILFNNKITLEPTPAPTASAKKTDAAAPVQKALPEAKPAPEKITGPAVTK